MIASLALAVAMAAAPTPTQRLNDARKLVEDLQYEQALKTLNAALDQSREVDHETLVGLYLISGVAWAALDKPAKAKEAFQRLLSIEPGYELSKDLPPRTRTPFFEAKTWLSGTTPVTLKVEPVRDGPTITTLNVLVTDNALVPARQVRFTLTVPGRTLTSVDLSLEKGRASVPVGAPSASWTAEVMGEKGVLRADAGDVAPLPVAAAPPPLATTPSPEVQQAPGSTGWMRPTGIAVGVAGLAALAAGGVFGFLSQDARTKIASATKNDMGIVTGITEREAQQLDQQARTYALVANILLVSGGVLAATGIGLFIFGDDGTPDAPTVTLQLSPAGGLATVRF